MSVQLIIRIRLFNHLYVGTPDNVYILRLGHACDTISFGLFFFSRVCVALMESVCLIDQAIPVVRN